MLMNATKIVEALDAGAYVYLPKNSYPASIAGKGVSARVKPREVLALVKAGKARIVENSGERMVVKGVSQ